LNFLALGGQVMASVGCTCELDRQEYKWEGGKKGGNLAATAEEIEYITIH
jgi:hypothetical protein